MGSTKPNSEFLKRLLATFKIEAQDHLKALSSGLLALEQHVAGRKQTEVIETIFREAHSLKGASRAVGNARIERLCQAMESVFSSLKQKKLTAEPATLEVLRGALASLELLVTRMEDDTPGFLVPNLDTVIDRLEALAREKEPAHSSETEAVGPGSQRVHEELRTNSPSDPGPRSGSRVMDDRTTGSVTIDTMRVPVARLDSILLKSEDMVSAKIAAEQRAADLADLVANVESWKKEWRELRLEAGALERLLEEKGADHSPDLAGRMKRCLEFLDWNESFMESLSRKISAAAMREYHDHVTVGAMVDSLNDDLKRVLLLPFSTLLEVFPRLVHDLARERGKEIALTMLGTEVEADRRILEEVKDPLMHLVRNCIDHGLEKPQEREQKGKPRAGTITIGVSQQGNNLQIVVSDDGSGIDVQRVRSAAIKLGLLSRDKAREANDQDVLALVFSSGLTTSSFVTDLSGRGLGLTIVREKTEAVGGSVSFETGPGGTLFRLILPLTLARYRGLLVRSADRLFILPSSAVERTLAISPEEIKTVENRETIRVHEQIISLVRLCDVLQLGAHQTLQGKAAFVVVLAAADVRMAFLVDEVVREQEVLMKRLGPQLFHVRNVAGATVLPNGELVPILNVSELMKSGTLVTRPDARQEGAAERRTEQQRKSVLVVEDSITARTLLKNILESSGYAVTTAVDGIDGFTQLKMKPHDAVLSDVDMPRMNGFDLTLRIREDKQFADLPVVLLTALESREDKERGIEVGANAYLIKSSFDQSNLLATLQTLI